MICGLAAISSFSGTPFARAMAHSVSPRFTVWLPLAAGALAFYFADRALERRTSGSSGGLPLALGALLDGIPEQLVLGLGLGAGVVGGVVGETVGVTGGVVGSTVGSVGVGDGSVGVGDGSVGVGLGSGGSATTRPSA